MKNRVLLPLLFCGLATWAQPAKAEDSTAGVPQEFFASPGWAPAAVAQTLKAAGPNAASLAVPTVVAAIQGLGAGATHRQIAAIVYAAVRVVPDNALQIVRAAVKAAPHAAPDIAAAAARAVPNPWKEVRYQAGAPPQTAPQNATPPPQQEPDFKSAVDRSFLDALSAVLNPGAVGDPMSLAEAIIQTAIGADPGVDPGAIQGAVEAALFGDPGQLFNRVGGSRGISGVGDAGNSNYANEPFRPGQQNPPSTNPPTQQPPTNPNPKPVSP